MISNVRSLALAGSAGFLLSLLSALPAGAHGLAGAGLIGGALHPLTGLDHLLLLIGVGALAARVDRRLLLPALLGALVGAGFGVAGGWLPAAEPLAALSVSALGVLLVLARRLGDGDTSLAVCGSVVGGAVALHALLHGHAADGNPSWWVGSALAAMAVVGLSSLLLRRSGARVSRAVGMILGLGGLLLAFAPLG